MSCRAFRDQYHKGRAATPLPMVPRLLKSRLNISLPREASWMPSGASLSPFNVFFVSAGLFTQHKIRRFGYIIEIPIK
jgi:hypothetical protein